MDNELATRISKRAKDLGGVTRGSGMPIINIWFSEDLRGVGYPGWSVSVEIKPAGKRGRYATARGHSIDQALTTLANEIGA